MYLGMRSAPALPWPILFDHTLPASPFPFKLPFALLGLHGRAENQGSTMLVWRALF